MHHAYLPAPSRPGSVSVSQVASHLFRSEPPAERLAEAMNLNEEKARVIAIRILDEVEELLVAKGPDGAVRTGSTGASLLWPGKCRGEFCEVVQVDRLVAVHVSRLAGGI